MEYCDFCKKTVEGLVISNGNNYEIICEECDTMLSEYIN